MHITQLLTRRKTTLHWRGSKHELVRYKKRKHSLVHVNKMPRKRSPKIQIKAGDFVFAKVNGYRAWPARVLEASTRYNIYFYGTCNTARVFRKQIFPYERYKRSLGNLVSPKVGLNSKFRMAMRHLEMAYSDPTNDFGYNQVLMALLGLVNTEELVYGTLADSSMSDCTEETDNYLSD